MRQQRGFTLIELMIVVMIIGLLASIALPAYQNYTIRTKLAEVVLAASACRVSVSEVYMSGGTGPGANGWGCEFNKSKYVQQVTTDANGVVSVFAQNVAPDVNGKALSLIPYVGGFPATAVLNMGESVSEWRCGPAAVNGIALKYLPAGCRGS
ncbi:MAG: pilin [Burkholderiales bacterium]